VFRPPRNSGSGFGTSLEPNRTLFPVQTQTTGGLPGPVANTTHIRSHAASYSCWVWFHVSFTILCAGSDFWRLQLQDCGGLTCVCVDAVSQQVAHWMKCLLFSSIQIQSHLGEVFVELWLAVVERWGWWWQKEVGSPEEYTVIYKSKCNEWQQTCTVYSSWILLHIAAGDSHGPVSCSKSVRCCVFGYRDTSWWTTAEISWLMDIKRTFFNRKDVWWGLSQDIAGI